MKISRRDALVIGAGAMVVAAPAVAMKDDPDAKLRLLHKAWMDAGAAAEAAADESWEAPAAAFVAFMQEPARTPAGAALKLQAYYTYDMEFRRDSPIAERRYRCALKEPADTCSEDVAVAHVLRDLLRMAGAS